MKGLKLLFLVGVLSLMLIGSVYAEWSQLITISGRLSTGDLSGSIEYRTDLQDDVNDFTQSVVEKNFNDIYSMKVTRSGSAPNHVDDLTLTSTGSIPSKFTDIHPGVITARVKVTIIETEPVDQDGDGVTEQTVVTGTRDEVYELPTEDISLCFSLPGEVSAKDEMTLSELCSYLNETKIIVDETRTFYIEETLDLPDYIPTLNDPNVESITYDWSYAFVVEQRPFNAR